MQGFPRTHRLSLGRSAFTGAAVLAALLLFFWATEAVADIQASQLMLGFFTQQALGSPAGMARGLAIMIVAGGLLGTIVAVVYNLSGFLDSRAKTPG
jgi:hypothetical protein